MYTCKAVVWIEDLVEKKEKKRKKVKDSTFRFTFSIFFFLRKSLKYRLNVTSICHLNLISSSYIYDLENVQMLEITGC